MSHSKLTLCTLALSCLLIQLHALKYIKTQDEGKFVPNNPLLLDIHDNTTFVLAKNHSISVYSPKVEKSCNITLDSKLVLNGTWKVKVLASNKTVVYQNDKFVVIDFQNCTTEAVIDLNATSDHRDHHDKEVGKVIVIPYNDTFDIIDPCHDCTPCRYNYKGEKQEVSHKLTLDEHQKDFCMDTLKRHDPSKGYLYVQKFANNTSLLKTMNSQFELLKQRNIDHNVTVYSGEYGNVTICYKKPEKDDAKIREPIVCELLCDELMTKYTLPLYKPADWDSYRSNVRVHNLRNGSALAVVSYVPETTADTEVYLQQIQADGQLEKEIKVITVPSKNVMLQSFLKAERGDDFVVAVSYKNPSEERMYLDVVKPEV